MSNCPIRRGRWSISTERAGYAARWWCSTAAPSGDQVPSTVRLELPVQEVALVDRELPTRTVKT